MPGDIETDIAPRNPSWIIKWLYMSFFVKKGDQLIYFDWVTKGRKTTLSIVTCTTRLYITNQIHDGGSYMNIEDEESELELQERKKWVLSLKKIPYNPILHDEPVRTGSNYG